MRRFLSKGIFYSRNPISNSSIVLVSVERVPSGKGIFFIPASFFYFFDNYIIGKLTKLKKVGFGKLKRFDLDRGSIVIEA